MSILYLLAAVSFAFMLEAMVARGGQPSGRHLSASNNSSFGANILHVKMDHRYNPDEKERFSRSAWIGVEVFANDMEPFWQDI